MGLVFEVDNPVTEAAYLCERRLKIVSEVREVRFDLISLISEEPANHNEQNPNDASKNVNVFPSVIASSHRIAGHV